MTRRFICYFDDIVRKWCVQDTDSLDMHYVADEPMGEEFALLLNLYQQTLDNVEKENDQIKKQIEELKVDLKMAKIDGVIDRMAQRPIRW